jgi:hypothetical protein
MFVAPFGSWLSLSLHCERKHALPIVLDNLDAFIWGSFPPAAL